MIVTIDIDEVVLVGIDVRRADAVRGALRDELTRLIQQRGLPDAWQNAEQPMRPHDPRITFTAVDGSDVELGANIARAIHSGGAGGKG